MKGNPFDGVLIMTDPDEQITTLRAKINDREREVTDADADALIDFSDALYLRKPECGDYRHLKLLRHCTIIAENTERLAEALTERDAAEGIVTWINATYDNEETNQDYRVALKVFSRHTVGENGTEPTDSCEWIPSGTSSNYDPAPDPAKMLDWDDDILPMVEACYNERDKALITLAWDAGPRSGELKALRVGDVADHEYGLTITVDGKEGQRTVTLIPSVPYVNKWLSSHPAADDSTAPLWCGLHFAEGVDDITGRAFLNIFKDAAERAGVTKPVTPTNFRKSSASHLASQGMNQAHIEDHHGWVRGSRVAARYVAIFDDESDRALAEVHGLDIEEDEPDPIGPVTCPRCERETPREKPACVWCSQPLSQQGKQQLEREERKVRRQFMRQAAENPGLIDDLENNRAGLEQFLEENPSFRREVEQFVRERAED